MRWPTVQVIKYEWEGKRHLRQESGQESLSWFSTVWSWQRRLLEGQSQLNGDREKYVKVRLYFKVKVVSIHIKSNGLLLNTFFYKCTFNYVNSKLHKNSDSIIFWPNQIEDLRGDAFGITLPSAGEPWRKNTSSKLSLITTARKKKIIIVTIF